MGVDMPIYITQFSYKPEAMAKLIDNPENRSRQIKKHLNQVGGKLLSLYYTFGDYDGICIYEVPEGVDAMSIMAKNWATDFLSKVKTTEAFTTEDAIRAFKKAEEIVIIPPKG